MEKNKPIKKCIIKPEKGWISLNLKEIWEYRDLFYFIVWRDFIIQYKQTIIGTGWAVFQPFCTMVVFSFFFGNLVKIPSDGIPYPIFSYAGLVPWTFFSVSLVQVSSCISGQSQFIKKIYFPRLIIPLSTVLSNCVNFLIAFSILFGMMLYFKIIPGLAILILPFLFILTFITALGVGLWLCVINVHFRDIERVMPFLVNMWMFATPVVYPASLLDEPLRTIYALNPMVGVIEGFRWALLGVETAPGLMIIVSTIMCIVMLIGGAYYFRRMEKTFADVL